MTNKKVRVSRMNVRGAKLRLHLIGARWLSRIARAHPFHSSHARTRNPDVASSRASVWPPPQSVTTQTTAGKPMTPRERFRRCCRCSAGRGQRPASEGGRLQGRYRGWAECVVVSDCTRGCGTTKPGIPAGTPCFSRFRQGLFG